MQMSEFNALIKPVERPLRSFHCGFNYLETWINSESEYCAKGIADIGFRMLQPVELFKAQGFPDSYIFTHGINEKGEQITLTKTEQTRMVGNSVCPQLAHALVVANFKHENKYRGAA